MVGIGTVPGHGHDLVCRGTDRHGDDRGRQRHRHRQHQSGGAGRDGQPVGAVIDDHPDRPHRPGGRLPLFRRADRATTRSRSSSPVSAVLVREGIHVGLGFTATVNVELRPGTVDRQRHASAARLWLTSSSTAVTTHFDSEKLASLPGARDVFAILANTPGVAMSKMDVGGNGALTLQDYTAYGLRATTGMNRNEVEGIRVGGANGANDNYFSDFASFAEIAITAVGNTAAMPVPGTLSQYVSKSGGNAYHGSVYADFQNDALEATNIDDRADRARRVRRTRPRRAGREPAAALPGLHCGRRRVPEEGQSVVVRRVPHPRRWRSATPGCSTRLPRSTADGRDRQGHLPAVSTPETRRLPAARNLSRSRIISLAGTSQPIADRRCAPSRGVSRERVEGRVQRRA